MASATTTTTTTTWPTGWPSFTLKDNDPTDSYQQDLKKKIIAKYGAKNILISWLKTITALKSITTRLATQGNASIPIFTYSPALSKRQLEDGGLKQAGCCIIRSVLSAPETSQHFADIQAFVAANRDLVTGWPRESIAIYSSFSSPTQLRIKTDPRHLRVQTLLNSLYTDSSLSGEEEGQMARNEPILYPDAIRIRQPKQEFLGLGPHVDSGSLSRWADPSYLSTYAAIFAGSPEDYDPYEAEHRKNADMAMWPGGAHGTVFRTFQGWTALTPCAPGEGGLMLVPDVKWVTAYMMLRPFFVAPVDGEAWEDGEKWTLSDETSWFPGTFRWDSQLLSPSSHPHLYLETSLLGVPAMEPGDTIWWHADLCHAVETTHNGTGPASVVYIPSAPSTSKNLAYIRRHWLDFVAGIPPDDYKYLDGSGSDLILSEVNEREMKGALPLEALSVEGRRGLGEGR